MPLGGVRFGISHASTAGADPCPLVPHVRADDRGIVCMAEELWDEQNRSIVGTSACGSIWEITKAEKRTSELE